MLLAAAAERPWEYAYAFDDIFDLVTSDSPDPALLCVASILSHVNQHRNESEFVWPARRPWPERFHGTWFSLLAQLEVCRVRYMRWFEEDPKMLVAALRGNWRMDDPLIEGLAADVAMEIVDRYGLWHQRDVQDAMAVAASRDPDLSHFDPQAEAAMWRSAMRRIDRLTQGSSIRR